MELGQLWTITSSVIAGIVLVASAVKAIQTITGGMNQAGSGIKDKIKRQEKMDKILDSADMIECSAEMRKKHDEEFRRLGEGLSNLTSHVDELTEAMHTMSQHDEKQDTLITDSLEERRLTTKCILALTQHAIEDGANGYMHQAHDDLKDYLYTKAHSITQ